MVKLSTQSPSHGLLFRFVDWIRPEAKTEEAIRKQADDIRERIKGKANADGLTVRSTPWSGSFAKRTGLRRHMRGHHEIEGQDIDLPFVVSPKTKEGENIDSLLDKFLKYAQATYPNTSRNPTKSSICLSFVATKLSYDLVPLLAVPGDDEAQILIRQDGERRQTSVQKHIQFIKTRTDKSNQVDGRVKFNEMVRLLKWWREMRQSESEALPEVPTILIDLLCAHAFDTLGVEETYTETLSKWLTLLAHVVRQKKRVRFGDFGTGGEEETSAIWTVLDPVNRRNNVVPTAWKNLQIGELASWFEEARDALARVIAADVAGNDAAVKEELVALFGNAIKDHGEPL